MAADSYQSTSEYVRELIRQAMESPVTGALDGQYFPDLKERLRAQATLA